MAIKKELVEKNTKKLEQKTISVVSASLTCEYQNPFFSLVALRLFSCQKKID